MVEDKNALSEIYWLLANIISPTLTKLKDWGDLNKTRQGLATKNDFLGDFASFVNFIESNCLIRLYIQVVAIRTFFYKDIVTVKNCDANFIISSNNDIP